MMNAFNQRTEGNSFDKGLECFFKKMYQTAINFLSEAEQNESGDGMTFFVRALAYLELDKRKEARNDFLRAMDKGVPVAKEYLQSCKDE